MGDRVECLLEVHKTHIEWLLVLACLVHQYSEIRDLISCPPALSKSRLFICNFCFGLHSDPFQYDLKKDLACVGDKSNCSVICTLFNVFKRHKELFAIANTRHYISPGDYPPNSPDLSSIENIWSIMAAAVYASPERQTLAALKRRLWKFLRAISFATLQNLIGLMPDRLKALVPTASSYTCSGQI